MDGLACRVGQVKWTGGGGEGTGKSIRVGQGTEKPSVGSSQLEDQEV